MLTRRAALVALAGLTLLTAACGSSSTTSSGTRTVDIDMHDIGYTPDHVTVHDGESIRFVFHNTGAIAHEASSFDQWACSWPGIGWS